MKRKLSTALLCIAAMSASAQNPVIRNQFSADPTARVFNGRVYLFPSHDIISPIEPERKWFAMADYHMFSSTDLTEWTDHGVILSQEQVPWGNPTGYSMWAPDCVEKDGKYYFFFPDGTKPKEGEKRSGFGIGVAIADNLFMGKFKPQPENIKGVMGIDPCVLQASDGTNVLFWGGGGLVQAKMTNDLLSIEGTPQRITNLPEGFKEGPFAFERNGKYYLTYPWVRKEGGTECLAYAMSDNPMGPWEYKGIIMQEHANGCWTNHHSIVEFKGQWYLFYHHNDYSPSFDKNRSVCIDSLFFNPDGTIQEVKPTLRGVGITDTRRPVQIDRYSDIGGGATIDYHDTLNCFQGWKTIMPKGGWVLYNKVDTKSSAATNVCLKMRSKTKTSFKLDLGTYSTEFNAPSTAGEWKEFNCTVAEMPEGVNDLRLTLTEGSAEIDWLTLTDAPRKEYFKKAESKTSAPDTDGFIRRWWLREPLDKPNRSNTVFVDSYLKENLTAPAIKPEGNDWHALESNAYNVKLFRFADGLEKQVYGVIFQCITYIDCKEEIPNVRLAVGSNSASRWWLNDDEVLMLSGDRRMVKDDVISPRITLKKGRNILRGAVINGPGMSDFCVRFINEDLQPVTNYTITQK